MGVGGSCSMSGTAGCWLAPTGMSRIGEECLAVENDAPKRPGPRNQPTGASQIEILDQVHDAVIATDLTGVIQSWNRAATQIYGWKAADVIGSSIDLLYFEEDRESVRARVFEPVLRQGSHETRLRNRHQSGREVFVHLRLSLLHDARNEVIGVVGCSNDVSEQKRQAEALSLQQAFSDRMLETAHCIVLLLDPEGRIVRFNRFMEELSGYTSQEVAGRDWFECFVQKDDGPRVQAVFRKALSGERTRGNLNAIRTRDGAERQISWWDAPLVDLEGRVEGLLSIGHDVTELIEAQEKMLLSQRLAVIGETITTVAHEARNELDVLGLGLGLLGEGPLQPEQEHRIAQLRISHGRLEHLFEEIRSFAAPIRLDLAWQDLAECWRRAWATIEKTGRKAKLRERLESRSLRCRCDAFRMEQVFRNLFENALAACADTMKTEAEIEIEAATIEDEGRSWLRIAVRDDGPGFEPRHLPRLFDPFFTTRNRGTGLGLALARRILQAHGGRISARAPDSTPSRRGAELVLMLPLESPEPAAPVP